MATAEANMPPLTQAEIRKAYLGVAIRKGGYDIIPVRNVTDPLLYEVFLQKIIFMSARKYEHQLTNRVLKWGGRRPARYSSLLLLAKDLKQHPGTITYMWARTLEAVPGTKVVQELWAGPVN
ncbi:MAG TPA: hypothetical protein ENI80_08695 [Acidiferrobacteraceae bacterium]|nr:hypothetical protein [Acidiferrobacteraceae bacterium]